MAFQSQHPAIIAPGYDYPVNMNNATFVGRLGKDAELKTLDSGKKVINFSLAVDDGKDRPPVWIDCAKWSEKTGVLPYLKKGTQVAVSGNVGLRKWETGATITLRVLDLSLIGSVTEAGQKEPKAKEDLPF